MRALLLAACALTGACAAPRPYGRGVDVQALFSGGYRALEHDRFADLDGHPVYAFELATRENTSGWGYEVGASYAVERAGGAREHRAEFDELSLGLRRSWQPEGSSARPYLGFGGARTVVQHRLHDPGSTFEDRGGAAYLHGGVLWDLGSYAFDRGTEVLVGVDLRAQAGDDADYVALALVIGFGQ